MINRHTTDSDRNGFDSEYEIPIDFLLGSLDSERFCSFRKIVNLLQIKYGTVVHDNRKKRHNW